VLVHDVMAAITTDPWSTDVIVPSSSVTSTGADGRSPLASVLGSRVPGASWPSPCPGRTGRTPGRYRRSRRQPVELYEGPERVAERGLGVGQRHPVLRPLRAASEGHRGQVEREFLGVAGGCAGSATGPAPWRRPRPGRRARRAAGEPQVGQRLVVDREDRAGERTPGSCCRSWRGSRPAPSHAVAAELDELADHAVRRSSSVIVRTRSVAVARRGARVSRKPTTFGISMLIGWPAWPPRPRCRRHPSRGCPGRSAWVWESVPTQVSGRRRLRRRFRYARRCRSLAVMITAPGAQC